MPNLIEIETLRTVAGDGSIYVNSSTTYRVNEVLQTSIKNIRQLKKILKGSGITRIIRYRQIYNRSTSNFGVKVKISSESINL